MTDDERDFMRLEHDLRRCLEMADGLRLHITAIRINEALEELKSGQKNSGKDKPSKRTGGAPD
ncbi:MAG: hypothetical protein AAGM33_07075 [Pseudomonadota bacterium]